MRGLFARYFFIFLLLSSFTAVQARQHREQAGPAADKKTVLQKAVSLQQPSLQKQHSGSIFIREDHIRYTRSAETGLYPFTALIHFTGRPCCRLPFTRFCYYEHPEGFTPPFASLYHSFEFS